MASFCQYTQTDNFPNGIDIYQLENEIILQFPTLLQIQIINDDVYVIFTDDQTGNKATLDGIITSHNPTVGDDPETNIPSVVVKKVSGSGPNAGGFSNLLFGTKLYENLPNFLEHDTVNTERVLIKENGTYDITYTAVCDIERCQMRVVVDDTNVVPGSEQESTPGSVSGENIITCRTVTAINSGSYVTVQLNSPSPGTGVLLSGLIFTIISQKAIKGDPGPAGPTGASGAGSGDVLGPISSNDNAVVRFNGILGDTLQNSGVILDDNDNITGVSDIECKTLDTHNESPGTDGHVRFRVANDYGSDTYNHGVDVTATNRVLATIEEGTYRQAGLLGARSSDATSTVFGVTLSNDSGSTWDPCLILRQDCNVGICKLSPTESLDVVGNIAVTGTVDGRDIASDGATQDSHIADATLHRIINDAGTSATELWSASKIDTELTNQTHVAADITDFNTAADARITLQAGNANGLATLDGDGKVPASQLSLSGLEYQGAWDADTNSPTLTSSVGTQGHYYVVSVAGTTTLDGFSDWQVGDWATFNGTVWEQSDHTDSVTSVAGKQGVVVLATSDIASGTFADARITVSNVTQHEGSITIGNLIGAPTGAVVGTTDTQTLSAKTLTLPKINDTSSNHTYNFGVSELALDRTITLPLLTGNDTFVFASHTETLNNKTMTSTSNDVAAKSLHSATTIVDVVSATAPTSGQVLTATSGTSATWQTPSGGGSISETTVSATITTSTTSGSYIVINSMTSTPASGTYFVSFSTSGSHSSKDSDACYAIYSAGSKVVHSERNFAWSGGADTKNFNTSMYTQAVVTVNGSQAIDVRYHNGGSGTFTIYERSMTLLKIA